MDENKKVHNTKYNYDNLFLRNLLIGLRKYLKDRLSIIYTSEEQGEYEHKIPFYFSMGGSTQFLLDAFLDDIPDIRVKSNTDVVPRAHIKFDTWGYNKEEFTNPNVWYAVPEMNEDEELITLFGQIKWVPITIEGSFDFTLVTMFEQFAIWEEFVTKQFSYSYFNFEHKYITIQSYIEYGTNASNSIPFDKDFSHQERIVMPFSFTIRTHLPIFDWDNRLNNKSVEWKHYINENKNHNDNSDFDKKNYK